MNAKSRQAEAALVTINSPTLQFDLVQPSRQVVLGSGSLAAVPAVLNRLGMRRAQLVVSPSQRQAAHRLMTHLGAVAVAVADRVETRITDELVTHTAEGAVAARADGLVCVGGGAAIGLAKATCARLGIGYVAVPTTYSGSEVTDFYGVVDSDGQKQAFTDGHAASMAIVYDPDLTLSLPAALTASSGINAAAQAVGSIAQGDHPVAFAFAFEGLRRLQAFLPDCVDDPADLNARTGLLSAAYLCGSALAIAGLSAHHRLVSSLGDHLAVSGGVPHAQLHAALLPHTARAFAAADPAVGTLLARVVDGDPGQVLFNLVQRVGLDPSLANSGVPDDAFAVAADAIVARPLGGRPELDPATLHALLYAAYRGDRPRLATLQKELT